MWEGWGVCYPPRRSWTPLAADRARRAWGAVERAVPRGIYVHLPEELRGLSGRFTGPRHPYIDCLAREADLLQVSGRLRFATLYIGSFGDGTLTSLSAPQLERFLGWLRRRFRFRPLRQFTIEVDFAALTAEQAGALAGAGVDRVSGTVPPLPPSGAAARAFCRGVKLCRGRGIRHIDLDLMVGRPEDDAAGASRRADLIARLAPDTAHLQEYVMPGGRPPAERAQMLRRAHERLARANPSLLRYSRRHAGMNLQLLHASRRRATILGLGWGAVSHVYSRLTYEKRGTLAGYMRGLLRGRLPRLAGAALSARQEQRAFLIGAVEERGVIDRMAFRQAFGREPEEAFPGVFRRLTDSGLLARRGNQLRLAAGGAELFYERRLRP